MPMNTESQNQQQLINFDLSDYGYVKTVPLKGNLLSFFFFFFVISVDIFWILSLDCINKWLNKFKIL